MYYIEDEKKEERFWTGNIALFIAVLICLYLILNSADLFTGIRYGTPVYRFCRLLLSFAAGYGAAFCVLDFCRGSLRRTVRGTGLLFTAEIVFMLYRMFSRMQAVETLPFVLLIFGSLTAVLLIFHREHLIV